MEGQYTIQKIASNHVKEHPEQYNSYTHRADEYPQLETEASTPYDMHATDYNHWLPLITESQGISPHDIITVSLSRASTQVIFEANDIGCKLFEVRPSAIKELISEVKELGDLQNSLDNSEVKWCEQGCFARCDEASPKDGAVGNKPLRSLDDALKQILTSYRVQNAMRRFLQDTKELPTEQRRKSKFNLYFLPWDTSMNTAKEFRIFVPPCSDVLAIRITAISQYRWHASLPAELQQDSRLDQIYQNAQRILKQILTTTYHDDPAKITKLTEGFTFDIQSRPDGCALIELNIFGATRAAGSCLFHWITDYDILYCRGAHSHAEAPVIFRISVDDTEDSLR